MHMCTHERSHERTWYRVELNSNGLMAGVQGNDGIARYGRNDTLTMGNLKPAD